MKHTESFTPLFSVLQAFYLVGYCVAVAFAAMHLQWRGCTNAEAGLVLAAGCLLGTLLGVLVSTLIDRHAAVTVKRLYPLMFLGQLLSIIALIALPLSISAVKAVYVLYMAFCLVVNPLDLKLYSDLSYAGKAPNYGFSRGMGSLAYVIASMALGPAVRRFSAALLPWAGLVMCLLQAVAHVVMFSRMPESSVSTISVRGVPLLQFFRGNKRYCLLLLGVALLFVPQTAVSNFRINIVRSVGGNESTMGLLTGFTAASEIPFMLLFTHIARRWKTGTLMRFSLFMFTVKIAAMAAANSIGTLFAASVLHGFSYALFMVTVVGYVQKVTDPADSAKAQSLMASMSTVGSVIASLSAGFLLDAMPVSSVLWLAAAFSALSTVIAFLGLEKNPEKAPAQESR